MGLKNFFLDNVVDTLIVRYLRRRVENSSYWKDRADYDLQSVLDLHRTPIERESNGDFLSNAERMFEDLYPQIEDSRGPNHHAVVIDTITREWELALSYWDAEQRAKTMKNPQHCYVRPVIGSLND